jgi:hypothetical protein
VAKAEASARQNPAEYPQLINQIAQVDPKKAQDMRERLVPGMGLANTAKDAGEVKQITGDATSSKRLIDELRKISDTISQNPLAALDPKVIAKAESTRQLLMGKARVPVVGPGPVNESEQKRLESVTPSVTAILSLGSSNRQKLDTFEELIENSVKDQLSARGINGANPSAGPTLSPEHQAFADWARKQPANDPKAQAVLKKLGIR